MDTRTIARYMLIVFAVIVLGALAGWYFFLRSQSAATSALDAARGLPVGNASPFGAPPPATGGGTSAAFPGSSPVSATPVAQLWHIAAAPAAGIGFASATSSDVRYVERATGYIFDANPQNGVVSRLTNTLMPKIYEATLVPGDRVIERSLDNTGAVTTFLGSYSASASSSGPLMLTGEFLAPGIPSIAADLATGQILYLSRAQSGEALVRSDWDGANRTEIFSSPLSQWRTYFLSDGREIIAQSAADSVDGYAFELQGGGATALLGPLPGLVILPRANSSALLYSLSQNGTLSLFAKTAAGTIALPVRTIAEKCAWAPLGASASSTKDLIAYCGVPQSVPNDLLDLWYRGETHTADSVWRVDASTGEAQLIYAPQNVSIDVENPVIDGSGEYFAFMNAADDSPWSLRIATSTAQ